MRSRTTTESTTNTAMINERGVAWAVTGGESTVQLGMVTQEWIREREKTKRTLIGAVVTLVAIGAAAVLLAPAGREHVGYVIGGVSIVLALGAIGVSTFIMKLPGVRVDTTDRSSESIPSDHIG
jgi:hypothetical protein